MTELAFFSRFAELYPFESNYHSMDSLKLHYLDEGQGEPLVMVHGNPTWSFYYRNLIQHFSSKYRTIVPDHIGCGLSDKPQEYCYQLKTHIDNLESLLDSLELPSNSKITLIMHDWGGWIGMGYARRHPEKIGRLIFLNTGAFHIPDIKAFPQIILINRIPVFGALSIRGLNLFAKLATVLAITKPERRTKEVKAGLVAPYNSYANRIAVHNFVLDIPIKPTHPSYETVSEIENALPQFNETPKLFCWGKKDFCLNDSFLHKWEDIYPRAEYAIYNDAGHYILEDAHELVAPRIEEFLNKHPLS